MPKVDAPIVGGKLSTNDPSGSLKSILLAVGGVGLAVLVIQYGFKAGNWMTSTADSITGLNASGASGPSFDGSP